MTKKRLSQGCSGMVNAVGGVGMGWDSLALGDMTLEDHAGRNART